MNRAAESVESCRIHTRRARGRCVGRVEAAGGNWRGCRMKRKRQRDKRERNERSEKECLCKRVRERELPICGWRIVLNTYTRIRVCVYKGERESEREKSEWKENRERAKGGVREWLGFLGSSS